MNAGIVSAGSGAEALRTGRGCWNGLEGFRTDRLRNKRYTYGDQWIDRIVVDGVEMTEESYITGEGNIPLKNNLIRRLVRSVLGVFRDRLDSRGLASGRRELYSRSMEEFLISGLAVHRLRHMGSGETVTERVSAEAFFMDSGARDPNGGDLSVVGQWHDLSLGEFMGAYARDREHYRLYDRIYGMQGRVKVCELWTRERRSRVVFHDMERGCLVEVDEAHVPSVPHLNRFPSVWRLREVWRVRHVASDGRVLIEGDSPLPGGGHPFIIKAYPFLDGEIHSFVSDIIDQQRYANRLITLYDWVMRASAKGVLLFPEDALPHDGGAECVAREWSRFNGVLFYRPRPGQPLPQQVSNTVAQTGVADLLNIQLKMMEDIAGVNGALQGRVENRTTSGTLYQHQTENALTSLRDILETFDSFVDRCEGVSGESQNTAAEGGSMRR